MGAPKSLRLGARLAPKLKNLIFTPELVGNITVSSPTAAMLHIFECYWVKIVNKLKQSFCFLQELKKNSISILRPIYSYKAIFSKVKMLGELVF